MTETLAIDLSEHRAGLTPGEFRVLHRGGVRGLGVRVSIAYSSSGELHADPTAARYVSMARSHGWLAWGYCYLNPRDDRKTEAARDGWEQGLFYTDAAEALDLDGHFLDIEESGIRHAHIVHALAALRKGLRTSRVSAVNRYSSAAILAKYPDAWDLFDGGDWLAHYGTPPAPGETYVRELDAWETPPEREEFRAAPLHQFGQLGYKRPNGSRREIDGNVYAGTQLQLAEYLGAYVQR